MAKLGKLTSLIPMHEIEHSAQQQIYDNIVVDVIDHIIPLINVKGAGDE